MGEFRIRASAGGVFAAAVTCAAIARADQPSWIGGHGEIGVLSFPGESPTYTFGLGPEFELLHEGVFHFGAGPAGYFGIHSGCGRTCAYGFIMGGVDAVVGLDLGPLSVAARVALLGGYSDGYPNDGYGFWILPSVGLGLTLQHIAIVGPFAGWLTAPGGTAEPSGITAGLQITSLF